MNRSINQKDKNNKYSAKASIFGSLAYAVLLAYFPISLFAGLGLIALEAISLVVIAVSAVTIFMLTQKKQTLLSFMIPAAIFFFFSGSFSVIATVFAFLGSVSLLACLLYKAGSFAARVFPFILTIAVYVVASLLCKSFAVASVCFSLLPAGVILAFCLSRKTGRVSTVCRVSLALLLPSAVIFALCFVFLLGSDLAELRSVINGARSFLIGVYSEGMLSFEIVKNEADAITLAKQSINLLFNLLPAIVICTSNILAFFLQSFAASLLNTDANDKETVSSLYEFKMSTGSAVVFLVFLMLCAMFDDESEPALAMAALNVTVILMPGLIYTALLFVKRLTQSPMTSCFGVIIYIGAISLLLRYPDYSMIVASLIGATILILGAAKKAIEKKRT